MAGAAHAASTPPQIVAGYYHTLALQVDGTVWAWGNNSFASQLGDGTREDKLSPIQITTLGNGVIALAAGHSFSLALKADGSVWAWGYNTWGQLGDGTRLENKSAIPRQVLSPGSNVMAITAGRDFAFALKKDGSVWAWGFNGEGQLGDSTRDWKLSPVQVLGPGSGIAALAAGDSHTLALKTDGRVWAWGENSFGQLGNGDADWSLPPIRTAPGTHIVSLTSSSRVAALKAGRVHSLALKADGSVWAWGNNVYGQVGNGSADTELSSPQQIWMSGSNAIALAAGEFHSLALKKDGSVWAWGRNNNGQLGDGTIVDKRLPVQILPSGSGVVALAAAGNHSLALKADGSIWQWGDPSLKSLFAPATAAAKLIPTRIPDFSLSVDKP